MTSSIRLVSLKLVISILFSITYADTDFCLSALDISHYHSACIAITVDITDLDIQCKRSQAYEVVQNAVGQDGLALYYVPTQLKADREIPLDMVVVVYLLRNIIWQRDIFLPSNT